MTADELTGVDPLMAQSEPDRCWTTVNTGEAMQGVMTPLDWTFFADGIERGARLAYRDLGILPRTRTAPPEDPNQQFMAVFHGRVAINVDLNSDVIDRLHGASGADLERDVYGLDRTGVDRPGTDRARIPLMLAGSTEIALSNTARVRRLNAELRPWWRHRTSTGSADPAAAFAEAVAAYARAMRLHLRSRFFLMLAFSRLRTLLERAQMLESFLALTSAGATEETHLALDLWRAAHGTLPLADFLQRHGYHGPNEAALSSRSWREDPRPVIASMKALVKQTEDNSPASRLRRSLATRAELEHTLMARVAAPRRPSARFTLRMARKAIACNESSKMASLLATDAARAAARSWGQTATAAGVLAEPDDLLYLTVAELTGGVLKGGVLTGGVLTGGPAGSRAGVAELIAERRRTRAGYLEHRLPQHWTGQPQPLPPETGTADPTDGPVTGLPVSAGIYEGRARVIHDPATEELEADEVLVCHVSDPSWTAVFLAAGAVVVDVGGAASHGAIVARELGLPCVIGAGDATTRIRTGDLVRVDGTTGTVEILERHSSNGREPAR